MWWRAVGAWLREHIDLDVNLDIDDGTMELAVGLSIGGVEVLTEHFSWPLRQLGGKVALTSASARRQRVLPRGA